MAPATVDEERGKSESQIPSFSLDETRNGELRNEYKRTFSGMDKVELMQYVRDPFWVRLRWCTYMSFGICWFAMLLSAIIIVVRAPRCPPLPSIEWWQRSAIYQVYPLSFKDSNGDGFGDLKGIESRVDHFSDLGVSAIWLNPIYKSPMNQYGYDIEDYKEIDSIFGDFKDFKRLIKKLNEIDIKLILDFVPNHTGNTSKWFENSRKRIEPFTDYYIWHDGRDSNGTRNPPNNWVTVYGDPAWEFDELRQQFYYHQFEKDQPDLNLRSNQVQEELLDILTFWMDLGVRGFRVDAASHLFEDILLEDEPKSNSTNDQNNYNHFDHINTKDLPENIEIIKKWRKHLNLYASTNDTGPIFLTVECTGNLSSVMQMYGSTITDFPLNFELMNKLNEKSTASDIERIIRKWLDEMPNGAWPNWVLGNHDQRRITNKIDPKLIDGLHMITTMLTGTPITYYGEEIGMKDIDVDKSKMIPPSTHRTNLSNIVKPTDPFRSPMQWSDESNAGFTDGKTDPWMSVNPDYKTINVKTQLSANTSHILIYKRLLELRAETAATFGSTGFILKDGVFGFARVKKGFPGLLVLVNFGSKTTKLDLANKCIRRPYNYVGQKPEVDISYKLPEDGMIELCSVGANSVCTDKGKIQFSQISLDPKAAILIQFVPLFTVKDDSKEICL